MTKKQFIKNMNELKRNNNKHIDESIAKLLKSGAIDLKEWENDFRLPKTIMHAICNDLSYQWRPLSDDLRRESKNIEMFL